MENLTPDSWDCEKDGHEFDKEGEYDPGTNSFPYLKCSHCGVEKEWEGDRDSAPEYDY